MVKSKCSIALLRLWVSGSQRFIALLRSHNLAYKSIWKPRDISNPEYFELEKPNYEPIEAIGIEIWTMQDGILFDNILIADDEKVAASYRETTWKPKYDVEKEKEKVDEPAPGSGALAGIQKKVFDLLYKIADIPFLEAYKIKIIDLIEKAETQPNVTLGVLASVVVVIFTILFRLLFGGKKPVTPTPVVATVDKKSSEASKSSGDEKEGSSGEKEEEEKEEDKADGGAQRPRRRRA